MTYTFDKDSIDNLLNTITDDDTVLIGANDFRNLISSGSNNAGRKPIAVDPPLFDTVVSRWQNGEITARQAMQLLNLKPNTFYRRIKERTENQMTDIKNEISEVKKAIHSDARDIRKDLRDIGKQVYTDAKEIKDAVDNKKQIRDIEIERAINKLGAELDHREEVDSLRNEVMKETEDLKNLNNK